MLVCSIVLIVFLSSVLVYLYLHFKSNKIGDKYQGWVPVITMKDGSPYVKVLLILEKNKDGSIIGNYSNSDKKIKVVRLPTENNLIEEDVVDQYKSYKENLRMN